MDLYDDGYTTVDYTNLIQSYSYDLTYIADLLAKLTGTYNILISSADGFNRNALAKKDNVEDAIERAEDLGKVIDKIIDSLEDQVVLYIAYLRMKNDAILNGFSFNEIVKWELDHHVLKHVKNEEHKD